MALVNKLKIVNVATIGKIFILPIVFFYTYLYNRCNNVKLINFHIIIPKGEGEENMTQCPLLSTTQKAESCFEECALYEFHDDEVVCPFKSLLKAKGKNLKVVYEYDEYDALNEYDYLEEYM